MKELNIKELSSDKIALIKDVLGTLTSQNDRVHVYEGEHFLCTISKVEENSLLEEKPSDVLKQLEDRFDQDLLDEIGSRSNGEAQNERDYQRTKAKQQ